MENKDKMAIDELENEGAIADIDSVETEDASVEKSNTSFGKDELKSKIEHENTEEDATSAEKIIELMNKELDDEDDFGFEDEFSNIPDSFFEDDLDSEETESGSINALLYEDDDNMSEVELEEYDSVSISDLKAEMQRIKDEARELREEDDEEEAADAEESKEEIELDSLGDQIEVREEDTEPFTEEPENVEPQIDVQEELPEEAAETPAPMEEKKIYAKENAEEDVTMDEASSEPITEHVITIDRGRVKHKETPTDRLIDGAFEAVEMFVFALLTIMLLTTFCFRMTTVSGDSMNPTFNNGDRLIISDLFYTPKVGDVIVFDDRSKDYGEYGESPIIKRVVAVEGDTVQVIGDLILVNEEKIQVTDYIENYQYYELGAGEIFVIGDNFNNSIDSRHVGLINVDSILGKVIFRFYYKPDPDTNGKIVFHTNFEIGEE